MKLSAHFTLAEATESGKARRLGLDNIPDQYALETMKYTALKMEAVRQLLGNNPINVSSWYRSPAVNKAVGGVPTSQHAKGEAVDFTAPHYGTPLEVCELLAANKELLNFDQLIYEKTWIHISFKQFGNRGNVLSYRAPGHYMPGLDKD